MYSKTTFPKFEAPFKLNPSDLFYTCGSCFASEFYKRLTEKKFRVFPHPFGIAFNPLSIAGQFNKILNNYQYSITDLIFYNETFHSLEHHGSFSHEQADIAIQNIQEQLEASQKLISKLNCLVLTLGSAHYYVWNENQSVVANCHKIPATKFTRKLASTSQITEALQEQISKLITLNPELKIILSVSPVRYLRDGFIENTLSKSRLLLSAEELSANHSQVYYFPAYEIFMDDLRDYRYVKDDLVHPNEMAVDYIWNYFSEAFFSEASRIFISKMNQWLQLYNHRSLNTGSETNKIHLNKLIENSELLLKEYPHLNFKLEQQLIRNKLSS
jgi:hypothetical protein